MSSVIRFQEFVWIVFVMSIAITTAVMMCSVSLSIIRMFLTAKTRKGGK